ncbi:MAG: agmatine deiminase family protein [Verrucomicrobia bacterium]|nr:agmatine deiminase family protein [Verrucomicrobiota bacterium]
MAFPRRAASPDEIGFRFPAEWEPQEAIWLSWPHRRATWPGNFRLIPGKFAEIVARISRFERVRINCGAKLQPRAQTLCARAGADLARVEFFTHPTNDAWCRDHGPIFVKNDRTREVAVTDWTYNAWGGKYPPYGADNAIPRRIAAKLQLRRFTRAMVLEGGSIDVNGAGDLLTTESCLLNPNRNPTLTKPGIERALREMLGVRRVHWLGDGIAGDDTDGHIDDLSRFFATDGIVTAVEPNSRDANYGALRANRERLASLRGADGKRFRIVELPMPRACHGAGQRLPASYANFLIINAAVLVPTFRQPRRDAGACEVLGGCFPGREIVPVDCSDLIRGLGTLHCISQQQPA